LKLFIADEYKFIIIYTKTNYLPVGQNVERLSRFHPTIHIQQMPF